MLRLASQLIAGGNAPSATLLGLSIGWIWPKKEGDREKGPVLLSMQFLFSWHQVQLGEED